MKEQLKSLVRSVRNGVIDLSYAEQLSHVSSALSMVDYLTVLFSNYIDLEKDKLVIGKPFGGQTYHVIFQHLIPGYKIAEENKMIISCLTKIVAYTEETLSNSLSAACGIALTTENNVFVNISDAQLQSGFFWEGCLFAGAKKQKNIILAVDYNDMQCLGTVESVMSLEPIQDKFEAFGWDAYICDGSNIEDMLSTFNSAFEERDKPVALIMLTKKGYGVEGMEDVCSSHSKPLTEKQYREYYEKNI